MSAALNTMPPFGLRISLVAERNGISAYGEAPDLVNRRSMRILQRPPYIVYISCTDTIVINLLVITITNAPYCVCNCGKDRDAATKYCNPWAYY